MKEHPHRFAAVLGLCFTAALFGVTPAILTAVGEMLPSHWLLMTVGFLFGSLLMMFCFRAPLKQDGWKGFRSGFLPGVLLLVCLYCLIRGGYGILWYLSLFFMLLIELFGSDIMPTAKNLTSVFLIFGGMLLLTDTVRVELFPFAFTIALPTPSLKLLWQATGGITAVFFLYIGRKSAPNCASSTVAAGAAFFAGLFSLLIWCYTEKAVLPEMNLKLVCLLGWCVLLGMVSVHLMLYGVRSCRMIPSVAALSLTPAVTILLRLVLAGSFPPAFDTAIGMLFLAMGLLFSPHKKQLKKR